MSLYVGQSVKLPEWERRARRGETHGIIHSVGPCGWPGCRHTECVSVVIIQPGGGSASVNYEASDLQSTNI